MNLNKLIGPLLGALVLTGVGVAIWHSSLNKREADMAVATASQLITVRIVSGSEKVNLLKDERLVKLLDSKRIALEVHKAGSREIATLVDL